MAAIKKWWQEHAWIIVVFTAVTLVGGIFIHMSTSYATIREVERVDWQVNIINETMKDVAKELSNVKTMVVMLNSSISSRLDSMDSRLDRIDDRLSRIEGNIMDKKMVIP